MFTLNATNFLHSVVILNITDTFCCKDFIMYGNEIYGVFYLEGNKNLLVWMYFQVYHLQKVPVYKTKSWVWVWVFVLFNDAWSQKGYLVSCRTCGQKIKTVCVGKRLKDENSKSLCKGHFIRCWDKLLTWASVCQSSSLLNCWGQGAKIPDRISGTPQHIFTYSVCHSPPSSASSNATNRILAAPQSNFWSISTKATKVLIEQYDLLPLFTQSASQ